MVRVTDIRVDSLADCPKCSQERLTSILTDRHNPKDFAECPNCMQFDLNSNSTATRMILVPKKYPRKMDDGSPCPPVGRGIGETHIRAVQQTFKWLLAAVAFATWNVSTGD